LDTDTPVSLPRRTCVNWRVMALDHYVSQVHLKNFYSPALGDRMYAVRKSNGKAFTPDAESVCRIEEGSTNEYLTHDRAIEEFLKGVEPQYNAAIKTLFAGEIDPECIAVIAGFAAYVMTCSPAAMRIQSVPLEASFKSFAGVLDSANALPPPPAALGSATLSELLQSGKIQFNVDPKYPQAIGIANILKMTVMLGNATWDILKNPFDDCPFFTSDFPAAIEEADNPHALNRIVPLTPHLAIRIQRDISLQREAWRLHFPLLSPPSTSDWTKRADRVEPVISAVCRGSCLLSGRSPLGQAVHQEECFLSRGDRDSNGA
jgi:Protein of unknown function (DUF4238)